MAKKLPPPSAEERRLAGVAAARLREVLKDPSLMGRKSVAHIDYSRPKRSVWITMWDGLPGFMRSNGSYSHTLLPGWVYTRREVISEMIPDLEALCERGERPSEVTNNG